MRSRFATSEKARATAEEFVEFSKGRAWIFTDTGSAESGDSLYQFTHRTFLEYFTGLFLFRTNPKPADLLVVLLPKITKREWDMVAQLAFHIQSRETEGASDVLMEALVGFGTGPSAERVNAITFAARCLEFIRTTPEVAKDVTTAAFDVYIGVRSGIVAAPQLPEIKSFDEDPLESLFGNLMRAQIAARESISETLLGLFVQAISGSSEIKAAIACEALFRLVSSYRRAALVPRFRHPSASSFRAEIEEHWKEFRRKIVRICAPNIIALARKYMFVARAAYMTGFLSLSNVVEAHGVSLIFDQWPTSFQRCYYTPLGQPIFYHFIECDRRRILPLFSDDIEDLCEIGRILSNVSPPWAQQASYARLVRSWGPDTYTDAQEKVEIPHLNGDAVFGLFALAAGAAETLCQTDGKETALNAFRRLSLERRLAILSVIVAWLTNESVDIDTVSKDQNLTAEQLKTIGLWLAHKVNLIDQNFEEDAPTKPIQESQESAVHPKGN